MVDAIYCIRSGWAMKSCCIAQGTVSSHLGGSMMKDTVRKRVCLDVLLGHFAVGVN